MSAKSRTWIAAAAALLLVLLPFGNFVITNYGDGSFIAVDVVHFFATTLLFVLAALGAVTGAVYLCTARRVTHPLARALLAAGFAFFLLFSYRDFYLGQFSDGVAPWIPAGTYLLLVVILATLAFRLAGHAAVLLAVLFFASANMALALPKLAWTAADAARTIAHADVESGAPEAVASTDGPNVYYFILDAYPNVSALRQNLDYDNEAFIRAMEARGFYHAEAAISSYNRTVFTLGSIFAQDYFAADGMTLQEGSRQGLTYPALLNAATPPELIAEARRRGYAFTLVGNYWARCAGPWVDCYEEATDNRYLADVFWSATPAATLVAMLTSDAEKRVPDVDAIGKVREHLRTRGAPAVPTFTFAHHLSPHAPYLFHADCSRRDNYELDLQNWPEAAKPYYLDNLACANIMAARVSDEIIARDPDAIIVFQGDHGTAFSVDWKQPFDDWDPAWVQERSSMLNLVRLPEACREWLRPDLDNVSTIRAVMGCVAGRQPTGDRPEGYVTTFSKENPDHGQVRRIDPTSFRPLPRAARD